ncbi:MAG: hypothetical protein WCP98_18265, partial [Actinomycetes bacterium]
MTSSRIDDCYCAVTQSGRGDHFQVQSDQRMEWVVDVNLRTYGLSPVGVYTPTFTRSSPAEAGPLPA